MALNLRSGIKLHIVGAKGDSNDVVKYYGPFLSFDSCNLQECHSLPGDAGLSALII